MTGPTNGLPEGAIDMKNENEKIINPVAYEKKKHLQNVSSLWF